ncbi:hypothetical protein BKA70DRAFT_1408854 [Coprinopsis sp. MPI-PUGE-AT-0042]|nr:hypothetical protein BKA70DRAFT_1408854 [Coprinopsis sp. MPI-PUGE-AT-0042]
MAPSQALLSTALAPPTTSLGPTPLPPLPWSDGSGEEFVWCEAYKECINWESESMTDSNELDIISARIMGYLLVYIIPSGRTHVAREILECESDLAKLQDLAKLYRDHLLEGFSQYRPSTPEPVPHPSRPSAEEDRKYFTEAIVGPPASHEAAKRAAVRRDGLGCLLTGQYEDKYFVYLSNNNLPYPDGKATITNAVHIVPPYVNALPREGEQAKAVKRLWNATVWSQFSLFGVGLDDLNGPKINRLANILTLDVKYHALFDRLRIWFEPNPDFPTGQHFIIHALAPAYLPPIRHVHLVNADNGTTHELPDPRYLQLHAAVCKITYLSDAWYRNTPPYEVPAACEVALTAHPCAASPDFSVAFDGEAFFQHPSLSLPTELCTILGHQ